MKRILLVVGLIVLIGCAPETDKSNKNTSIDCTNPSDTNGYVLGVDTIINSHSAGLNASHPLDMGLYVGVSFQGFEESEIETAKLYYPNNLESSAPYLVTSHSYGTQIHFYNAFFESYSKTNGLRIAPMTGYCVQIVLTNGITFAKKFDLERPDGSTPIIGEMLVHFDDFDSITSGGDYTRGLALPSLSSASITETELTFSMNINDSRTTEYAINIRDSDGYLIAEYFTDDALNIKNDGQKNYVINFGNIDTDLSPAELVLRSNYMFVMTYDTGNIGDSYNPSWSEIKATSKAIFFK
ncbi:hypothetical protein ACFOND_10595 [Reinekea marina]|uniref:Uncharacterized protein n=1 Tax=Reinekea marina TaxID=1310421 RepID=A0ABV7WTF0_9GAMM